MSTITDLNSTDNGSTSLTTINNNFDNLNTDKAEIAGQVFTGQVSFSGTNHAGLKVLSLTTTQRDALTPANGMLIYNSTTNKFQSYEGGAWGDLTAGAADATTSVKGLVEVATDAELQAGTETGGTGATIVAASSSHSQTSSANKVPVGTSDGLIDDSWLALTAAGDLPYSNGTKLVKLGATDARYLRMNGTTPEWGGANLDEANTFFNSTDITGSEAEDLTDGGLTVLHGHPRKNGATTRDSSVTSDLVIAHGLGATPSRVRLTAAYGVSQSSGFASGTFDAGGQNYIYFRSGFASGYNGHGTGAIILLTDDSNYNVGTVAVDATNITISWSKTGNPTTTWRLLWEAEL